MIIDPFLNKPKTLYIKKFMSHPVNDEILENLYEEVKEEFPNALEPFVIAEVQKRFEEMSL